MKPSGKPAMLYVKSLRRPEAAAATPDQTTMNRAVSAANVLRMMAQLSTAVFARRQPLAACAALATLVSLVCVSPSARANGRYPKADQLLVDREARSFTLRTTFGLLLSRDGGLNWDWVCERALGYSGVQDPTIASMDGGTLLAGLSEGIAHSADQGCNWAFSAADLNGSPVIDLTVRKGPPNQALALVWDAQRIGYSSRILASSDQGRSFSAHGRAIDPTVLVTTIDVAPSDTRRIYASGTRSIDGVRSGLLLSSDDDGEHWSEHALPFDPKLEQGVYIAAVDPRDADTVYLRTNSASVSRLLASRDGGNQVSVIYSGSLLAFALSPNGRQLYFGGEDGLHTGLAEDWSFERRSSLRVLCLAATADTVYACSDEHSGFTLGASRDGGSSFEPLLHLKTVRGPLSCTTAQCESDWPLVRAQLGVPPPNEPDAGSDDGGASTADASAESGDGGPAPNAPLRPRGPSCALGLSQSGDLPGSRTLLFVALIRLSRLRRLSARRRLPAK